MNLWHDVPLGDDAPNEINVIIEIPKGSHNKYEIDKETGLIKLDRANYSDSAFPYDYGFVPQTLWEDGDALDVIVLKKSGCSVDLQLVAAPGMIEARRPDFEAFVRGFVARGDT